MAWSGQQPGLRASRAAGPALACALQATLTLFACVFLALLVHEFGHAAAIRMQGGVLRGIDLGLRGHHGRTYGLYPFVEASHGVLATFAGGALANLVLGTLAMGTMRVAALRRLAWPPYFVAANAGVIFSGLLAFGIADPSRRFQDILVVTHALGLSTPAARWSAAPLGLIGVTAFGMWYARATLRCFCERLRCATAGDRFRALLGVAWAPVGALIVYEIGGAMIHRAARGSLEEIVPLAIFSVAALATMVFALRWIATYPGKHVHAVPEEPAALRRASWGGVAAAAVFLAVVATAVTVAGSWLDPHRRPGPGSLARWVEHAPTSERRLRLAGYWSVQLGRIEDALRYYERAREAAPRSAGALYDLGTVYHGAGRDEQALEMLRRAAALGPDLEAVPAKIAQVCESLGRYAEAARAWRRFVAIVRAQGESESNRRHARIGEARARRLEQMARDAARGAATP